MDLFSMNFSEPPLKQAKLIITTSHASQFHKLILCCTKSAYLSLLTLISSDASKIITESTPVVLHLLTLHAM